MAFVIFISLVILSVRDADCEGRDSGPSRGEAAARAVLRTAIPYRILSVTSVSALNSIDTMKKRMTILVSNIPAFW